MCADIDQMYDATDGLPCVITPCDVFCTASVSSSACSMLKPPFLPVSACWHLLQLLEWWYTSAEEKLGAQKALPPPPPPPIPHPAADGLQLPEDPAVCPICRKRRTNPAMVSSSGYVFCYPCIFGSVELNGCCPVTRLPAIVDQIRRLYQSA